MAYQPFRHLGLKILAIAIATLLWLSVAGEHIVERALRVPLEIRGKPENLEIVGDPPLSVDVIVRGASALLSRLDVGEVVVVLDLSTARPGSRLFPLLTNQVKAPYGVEVAQIVPGTLALELERSSRRSIPVVPAIEGEPAPGYVIGARTAEPSTVEVVGPETHVKALTEATTEPIRIDGQRESVRDVVTVGVTDSAVQLVEATRSTVVIEILAAPVERSVEGVPVRLRNLGAGLRARVTPSVAQVRIRGDQKALDAVRADGVQAFVDLAALDAVRADGVQAFVDLAALGPGRYNLRVQVDPAQDYGVSSVIPDRVEVTIR